MEYPAHHKHREVPGGIATVQVGHRLQLLHAVHCRWGPFKSSRMVNSVAGQRPQVAHTTWGLSFSQRCGRPRSFSATCSHAIASPRNRFSNSSGPTCPPPQNTCLGNLRKIHTSWLRRTRERDT